MVSDNRGQPRLSAIVQARRLSLFGHIARMPDETDAKSIITASPSENWRRPQGHPRTTWMKTIQQDLRSNNLSLDEAITGLRIIHSGDWCLRLALRTPSGACHTRRRRRRHLKILYYLHFTTNLQIYKSFRTENRPVMCNLWLSFRIFLSVLMFLGQHTLKTTLFAQY